MKWFESWFDSHYYHILYKHRDNNEAQFFLNNLLDTINPPEKSSFLDLACGKGRHACFLSQKGHKVVGIDLSASSISYAKQFESPSLKFHCHDMRKTFKKNYFDYVINIFTSFGHFETKEEDIQVLLAAHQNLKKNGLIIIDYFNAYKIQKDLIRERKTKIHDIEFNQKRHISHGFLINNIEVRDGTDEYHYQEKVRLLMLNDFIKYLDEANFSLVNTFGNYMIEPFQENKSNRLILIAKKIN